MEIRICDACKKPLHDGELALKSRNLRAGWRGCAANLGDNFIFTLHVSMGVDLCPACYNKAVEHVTLSISESEMFQLRRQEPKNRGRD